MKCPHKTTDCVNPLCIERGRCVDSPVPLDKALNSTDVVTEITTKRGPVYCPFLHNAVDYKFCNDCQSPVGCVRHGCAKLASLKMELKETLDATLSQRGSTHGDFVENARICHTMRGLFRGCHSWDYMPNVQKLVLDEIALKIARILSLVDGVKDDLQPSNNPEHWRDIQGYAKLGEQACTKIS